MDDENNIQILVRFDRRGNFLDIQCRSQTLAQLNLSLLDEEHGIKFIGSVIAERIAEFEREQRS